MDWVKVVDYASKISLATLLLLILIGGSQGLWVFGSAYKEVVSERNEWRDLALKGTRLAEAGAPFSVKMMTGPPAPYTDELTATRERLKAVSEAFREH